MGHISSSAPALQLNDAACALQTVSTGGSEAAAHSSPEDLQSVLSAAAGPGVEHGMDLPGHPNTNHSQRLAYERTLADCPRSATVHNLDVSFGYELVAGGLKFIYTLSPTPSAPADAAGISSIIFTFPSCTCMNPDMFTGLEVLEKTTANPAGTPLTFDEICGQAANNSLSTELGISKLGGLKGNTYTVGFTLGYPILGIGEVGLTIMAGGQGYKSPLCAPMCTPPPTPAPTLPPTASPTASPTLAPTDTPTSSPTSAPTDAPTSSPTSAPTDAPTPPPTVQTQAPANGVKDEATSFGDPHAGNLRGQKFNIIMPGNHTFLSIPRGADPDHAHLHVVARVDPVGPLCHGLLYITGLTFSGAWLGTAGTLEFTTSTDADMDVQKAVKVRVGERFVDVADLEVAVPHVAKVTEFQPERPVNVNQHATTLLVTLNWGPCMSKVRMVHQKEKLGFSNSLWFSASGLKFVQEEIGGILGLDDHTLAATSPDHCVSQKDSNNLRTAAFHASTVHACAAWSEDGDES